ncbi:exopolyphosphatase [Brevibacterium sp. 5221]|uniref:Exopolyphosphatase n=1 Tax=Brevibacterium rongguiense TaxID=2695267 RepID=A0A6N9H7Y7_9MICO|nr:MULTISPECIES: Ppx/GppA phosphatase family protein [Brevibacterium]MYM20001.1 exopolyphosphatase [Brevibacterium rongguiense]WAL40285.1 Ppx/GppA phosphatase family protein [Brevibacterium sp. BRM-1]
MTRVAAFDCGTNSLRLLIADIEAGRVSDVVREMRVVRLGQGVDSTGAFAPEALERTFAVCEEYAAICEREGAERRRFVATSATRDAANRDEFLTGVAERVGVVPEVISGEEEARLSFAGAVSGVAEAADEDAVTPRPPFLVMDLGGGSTELVRGTADAEQAYSMDIGCVRLTERHMHSDPPTDAEVAATVRDVDAMYEAAADTVDMAGVRTLIGVAGTATTVAAAVLGLERYDPAAIHGAHLPLPELARATAALTRMERSERAGLGYMHPGRVDVIGTGALVFARLVERISADVAAAGGALEVFVSETDILDGIALALGRSGPV